ncbi:MAG: dihydroorotate dehydrogenase [Actinomycetota bacterium]|nr:dihydroorotate dehydrogenase [Actinomycetota bacterium]
MPPDLAVTLANLRLANPVLAASGTFGAGREAAAFVDLASLGGVIVKSMTLTPWSGKPTPRMCETPSGMLNAIGIQNKGVEHFLTEDLPWLTGQDATVIASIAGNSVDEFVKVAHRIEAAETSPAAVELNISCPNLEDRNHMFAHSATATAEVVHGVRAVFRSKPVFAKLSPNVTSIPHIAESALEAGADGLSLINTVFGMAIDVASRRPKLAGGVGGLSGPAIRPIAVRAVHEVHRIWPHVPIIGQGGVQTAADALELIMAGASAIAVGTANFVDPGAVLKVAGGIRDYMAGNGVHEVADLVGCLKLEG